MASGAVWGIDIGQCAFKALRCRPSDDPDKIVAEAFDYIEYPKILSQPGADPVELVDTAIAQFLSRNSVVGCRVAISVGGQAGLARFIKLPPVEARKIRDIVRYEARQQIPFDLNDVIWDYQRMGGGSESEGFALEAEVGLFAMKRDVVLRTIEPLQRVGVEVDIVQLTPLAMYNLVLYDQMDGLPAPEEYDPENPPESIVVIFLGSEVTDLVITNGYRMWQRTIPLGGNHFTKALSKELKLTFAKAEHIKRNATTAADPKAVFQAMRPVFSDLLTELQRSIGYFCNLDRTAKIRRIIALGNAMKLPGLRRYLSQSLGYEIERLESFKKLTGSQVVAAPSFEDNLLSFGVCYGLALQAMGKAGVRTNLLPKEMAKERLIKRKKPWAIACVAALLLSLAVSFAAYSVAWGTVKPDAWKPAVDQANNLLNKGNELAAEEQKAKETFQKINAMGRNLFGKSDQRVCWLELLKAITACLPHDETPPKEIAQRNELHLTGVEVYWHGDTASWFKNVQQWYRADDEPSDAGNADDVVATPRPDNAAPPASPPPAKNLPGTGASKGTGGSSSPEGPAWIVRLKGYHYHNADPDTPEQYGPGYVRNTLVKNLRDGSVKIPDVDGAEEVVSMSDLGISFPVLRNPETPVAVAIPNPEAEPVAPQANPGNAANPRPAPGDTAAPDQTANTIQLEKCNFVVEFCWKPTSPTQRRETINAAKEKASAQPAE